MKIRICFEKTEIGRYLSHLDLMRTMERSLRRAKAPLAFSEGFNPHIKMSFASALAVGVTGKKEYLDLDLSRSVDVFEFCETLKSAVPPALSILDAREIDRESRSLSSMVNLAIYSIAAQARPGESIKINEGIARIMAATELYRELKRKPGKAASGLKDVRPLIRSVKASGSVPACCEAAPEAVEVSTVIAELILATDGQLRAQDLWDMICDAGGLDTLQPPAICRQALLIYKDDKTISPMEI